MKIAFNTYPLNSGHKFRGVGRYTQKLLEHLKEKKDLEVIEFQDKIPISDLIHYPWFDLFYKSLPLKSSVPRIVTVHDVIPLVFPKKHPTGIRAKVNFFFQKLSLAKSSAIITDSENSKKDIVKYLKIPSQKIHVVPLAADDDFKILSESQNLRIKRKYNLPDKFLLFVGDANYEKNLSFLINGFSKLKDNFKDLKLVLVNAVFLKKVDDIDHPELQPLKDLNKLIIDLNLSKEILRIGQVDQGDLPGFYNLATLYIQPSLYEGFGLPVLEAMACGTPCVISKTSSLPEVGGSAAVYFDPTNLDQFVSTLENILQDKSLMNKLTRLGLSQASKFTWKKVIDQTITVYHSIK